MNKNGHAFGGLAICVASIYVTGFNFHSGESIINTSLLLGGIVIGSFLPDLDADYSYFNYKVPLIPDIYKGLRNLTKKKYALRKFFQHRGIIMHSIWTLVLIALINIPIVLKFNQFQNGTFLGDLNIQLLFTGLYLGISGHLILDMLTRTGLRYVVYPFNVVITKYTIIKPVREVKKQTKTSIKQLFKVVKKQLSKQK